MDLRLTARGDVDCVEELVNHGPAGGIGVAQREDMLASLAQVTTGPSAGD